MRTTATIPCILAACALAPAAFAQQSDVTFFVIGKHANYLQGDDGEPQPVDYSFFSEIFMSAGGDAHSAALTLPGGERVGYRDMRTAAGGGRDNILLISGEDRFTDAASLQRRYPDGRYRVSFETPSGSVERGELAFMPRPLPSPPVVTLRQGGEARCAAIRAGEDLTVSWRPFAEGRADPHAILDDLIFVILTDDDGTRVAHSGRPFEGRPFLTYRTNSFTIDGEAIQAGTDYTLSVEHAILDDTQRFAGVPAFTTRAVTTKVALAATDEPPTDCGAGTPPLDEQITMFYYEELDEASEFYGTILGLEKTFDWEWVEFFKTGPASSVGIVRGGEGAYHEPKPGNAVMLSMVTSDVDAWYERIKDRKDLVFLKRIGDGGGIRSFLLEDPGGYTVEFFEWLDAEE